MIDQNNKADAPTTSIAINWQTAIVLAVFIAAWAVLAYFGKPIPVWMAAAGAVVGKIIIAMLPQLIGRKPNAPITAPVVVAGTEIKN